MVEAILMSKLASLEEEIRLLKSAMVKKSPSIIKKGLASLEGYWKGKADFYWEEIERSEIKVKEF